MSANDLQVPSELYGEYEIPIEPAVKSESSDEAVDEAAAVDSVEVEATAAVDSAEESEEEAVATE